MATAYSGNYRENGALKRKVWEQTTGAVLHPGGLGGCTKQSLQDVEWYDDTTSEWKSCGNDLGYKIKGSPNP